MESFSPIWVLEEAELTHTEVLQLDRLWEEKWKIYWKKKSFGNDIQSPIFALKATYSQRHEGSLNEDAGSFDLYSSVIIGSSEMISKPLSGLVFHLLQTLPALNFGEELHFLFLCYEMWNYNYK